MYAKLKCDYLKQLRARLAEINGIDGFEYEACTNSNSCLTGTCPACEEECKKLTKLLKEKKYKIDPSKFSDIMPAFNSDFSKLEFALGIKEDHETEWKNPTKIKKINNKYMEKQLRKMKYSIKDPVRGGIGGPDMFHREQYALEETRKRPDALCKFLNIGKILGISRHRIHLDGPGVVTLIGMYGCNLNCKYCINAGLKGYAEYTMQELYDDIESDSIYFETTNGGLCFGGHEPLLQQSFVKNFIKFIREKGCTWKVGIETNLNYKLDDELIKLLDFIIVDVKSMNPDIYQSYTGKNNKLVIDNIKIIKDKIPDILIRVPLIKNFTDYRRKAPCFSRGDIRRFSSCFLLLLIYNKHIQILYERRLYTWL